MKQMNIPSEMIVDYDYQHADKVVKVLKPVIWQDGDAFCCLLGPDPATGVFGCGDTPDEATSDWKDSLTQLVVKNNNSEIVQFVKKQLRADQAISKANVLDFESQFKPGKEKRK